MRRTLAVAMLALATFSTAASAQSGGTVTLSSFLQSVLLNNTGTTTIVQFQYSHGIAGDGVATWDTQGNSGLAGSTGSNFLSDPRWFQTATWSGLNILAGQSANFGSLDIDMIAQLNPLSIDQGILTGGLQGSYVRAWYANGDVLSASLVNGSWIPSQDLVLSAPEQVVPEPATVTLMAVGLAGLILVGRRRRA